MIEINLVPGRKKKRRGAAPTVSFRDLSERVRDPLLAGAVGAWAIALAVTGFVFVTETRKAAGLEAEVADIRREAEHYRTVIEERRRQQGLHDLLVREFDEIRSIDDARFVWPHIMQEVTRALPDYTWIVGLEFVPQATPAEATASDTTTAPDPVRFTINGRTSDIGAYTRFLRQLGSSAWLTNIVPGATSTLVEENRPITAFVITGQYQRADSAFINVAPLEQGAP